MKMIGREELIDDPRFATGDVRGNENVELTTLTTLFVRNHNFIAKELAAEHPAWTDQQLYDEARKLNIADYQSIIYNEWIPAVLGPNALPAYKGYNSRVNPSIANEFSTVAFRFGHSLLSGNIERQNSSGQDIADVNPGGVGMHHFQAGIGGLQLAREGFPLLAIQP